MTHRLLIVVPTHNEAETLPKLWSQLPTAAAARTASLHVLVVDDISTDGTRAWVRNQPAFGTSLFLLEREAKLGLGTAYVEGFRWALARDYTLVMEMDADLSHDPAMIPAFVEAIEQGADLVLGSRYVGGVRVLNWPIERLLLSLGAARYVQTLTRMPFSDPTGGFKCFRRTVLEAIDLGTIRSNGYSFQIEMTHKAWMLGFEIREVPIVFADRTEGTSKMSGRIAREAVWQVMRLAAGSLFKRRRSRPPTPEERAASGRRIAPGSDPHASTR